MASQYGEDEVLLKYFNQKPNGILVDVGAADGVENSNSHMLITKYNWKGILIEPHPLYAKSLLNLYKDNKNVAIYEIAVYNKQCQLPFYIFGDPTEAQVSTLDETFKQRVIVRHGNKFQPPITVECDTLTNILDKLHCPANIDFLSVDCEGADLVALQSLDWKKYVVDLVCVEHSMPIEELKAYMDGIGFDMYYQTGGNTFFVRKK